MKDDALMVKKGRPQALRPIKELLLTLVRIRLGLIEQDLAYRFQISKSTNSRIILTWINVMYLEMKNIPLWPPKEVIKYNMARSFKEKYPNTRVITDATEVYTD